MPPDDPMFDTTPDNDAAPAAPVASPEGTPNGAPAPQSPEDVQRLVTEAVNAAVSPLKDTLADVRAENHALRSQIDSVRTPAAPPPAAPDGSFTDRFVENPEETIQSLVKDTIQSSLAPHLATLGDTAHQAILAGQQTDIDTRFGEGTWEEEFLPMLERRFDQARQQNPSLLSNVGWLQGEVNAVKGFKMDALTAKAASLAANREKASADELERVASHVMANATNLVGGIRTGGSTSRELSPEEQAYVDARNAAGLKSSKDTVRSNQSAPSSLKAWREHRKGGAS